MIPNEDEAHIVKQIYEWTVKNNYSAGKIARLLTSMGVPTYNEEQEWHPATIKTILTNPTYVGKVRWNDRMQVKTMVNGELVTSRPRSNHTDHYMVYDGKHKQHALVDEETFKAASSKFYSDKTKANHKLQNPLAGLLMCPNCGKVMVHQQYKNRNTPPRFNHTQSQLCKVKSVLASDVFNALTHALKMYIEDFEMKIDNLPDVDENTIQVQLDALQAEKRKIEKKMAKLFDAWEDEKISDNEFVQRKAVNNAKIEAIDKQMEELEESIPEKEEYQEMVMRLTEALDSITDETLDAEIKNYYLKAVIDKIEFTRENNDEFILDLYLK